MIPIYIEFINISIQNYIYVAFNLVVVYKKHHQTSNRSQETSLAYG